MEIGSVALGSVAPSPSARARGLSWRFLIASFALAFAIASAALALTVRSSDGFAVWSDGVAYFLYSRSIVVDHDFDITNEFEYLNDHVPRSSKALEPLRKWTMRRADGTIQPAWPVGAGLVMAPFYALGYGVESLAARFQHRVADSYGLIPQVAFALGCVLLGLVGLWAMVLACREVADDRTAYQAGLGAVLCGPAVFYLLFNPTMAHAISLGLIGLVTLLWIRAWRHGATARSLAAMGLLLGIAATVRYQNAIFGVLLAALVLKELREHGLSLTARRAIPAFFACVVPVIVLVVPMLKISSGTSENAISVAQYPIDFASPYFVDVLVSCRHGAFYWAPVLAAGFVGLLWAGLRREGWALASLAAVGLNVYLIGGLGLSTIAYGGHAPPAGWLHHWDDAPSFGMRYLTECAPLFALGLAFLMQRTAWSRSSKTSWMVALGACAAWNAMLIVAYGMETISRSGCISYADMARGIAAVFQRIAAHL
jgi:hypothetical protein